MSLACPHCQQQLHTYTSDSYICPQNHIVSLEELLERDRANLDPNWMQFGLEL